MSQVRIPSDDGGSEPSNPHLVILGGDDYYVSIDPGNEPVHLASVRLRTSGARDWAITWLVAAMYHYAKGNRDQALACARGFIDHVNHS